jgi:hypothetical protein
MNDLFSENDIDNDRISDDDRSFMLLVSPSSCTQQQQSSDAWIWDDNAIQTCWKHSLACYNHQRDIVAVPHSDTNCDVAVVTAVEKNKIKDSSPSICLWKIPQIQQRLSSPIMINQDQVTKEQQQEQQQEQSDSANCSNNNNKNNNGDQENNNNEAIVHFFTHWNPKTLTVSADVPS